ncbi:MAG: hypothetical protein U0840_19170 [Gemmataceae bacterium]
MRRSAWLPWLLMLPVGVLLAALAAAGRSSLPDPTHPSERPRVRDTHPVTARQLAHAGAALEISLATQRVLLHDGRQVTWPELAGGKPVLLIFARHGCPCLGDIEPHLRAALRPFADRVQPVYVIDAAATAARDLARSLGHHDPVIADPDRALITHVGALNGGYLMLVTPDGLLDTCWPGCSAESLLALQHAVYRVLNVPASAPLVTTAPAALTTGCPYLP